MKQARRHLTYANVMSSIAVFLMLGGATAVAATKIGANELKANSVKTGKIVKEAVTAGKIKKGAIGTSKLANGSVTSEKLADNAVTTSKIANDAVTGEKVNESTLGTVPSAATAGNVNGQSVQKLAFRTTSDIGTTGPQSIFNAGGLQITATCTGGNITLLATTSKQDSSIYIVAIEGTTILREIEESGQFDAGNTVDLLAGGGGNTEFIQFEFDAVDGTVITGILNADEDGDLDGCRATGHVTVG